MKSLDRTPDDAQTQAYGQLDPDHILSAVESVGLAADGTLLALNSYENRVYRIGIDESSPVVAKFYRPRRWSDDAILEEHAFALALAEAEIPVVPPMVVEGATLHRFEGFRFAVFANRGGRAPELDNVDHLNQLGRFIGRLHRVGAAASFANRPLLTPKAAGEEAWKFLLSEGFIPADLELAYRTLAEELMQKVEWCFDRAGEVQGIRLHGDCHPGNILWTPDGPHIVDLDDARMGPAVQDLWMFLAGDRPERMHALGEILDGYTEFNEFNTAELHLIEALRTLRLVNYYAWLALRWNDPAFPRAFPWFNTQRAWEQHILDLREQSALMDEAPLVY